MDDQVEDLLAVDLIQKQSQESTHLEERTNTAAYTANISRGWVGRGGNARFHTFKLEHHGPMDQRTNGRMDKASYRVACPRLKRSNEMFQKEKTKSKKQKETVKKKN